MSTSSADIDDIDIEMLREKKEPQKKEEMPSDEELNVINKFILLLTNHVITNDLVKDINMFTDQINIINTKIEQIIINHNHINENIIEYLKIVYIQLIFSLKFVNSSYYSTILYNNEPNLLKMKLLSEQCIEYIQSTITNIIEQTENELIKMHFSQLNEQIYKIVIYEITLFNYELNPEIKIYLNQDIQIADIFSNGTIFCLDFITRLIEKLEDKISKLKIIPGGYSHKHKHKHKHITRRKLKKYKGGAIWGTTEEFLIMQDELMNFGPYMRRVMQNDYGYCAFNALFWARNAKYWNSDALKLVVDQKFQDQKLDITTMLSTSGFSMGLYIGTKEFIGFNKYGKETLPLYKDYFPKYFSLGETYPAMTAEDGPLFPKYKFKNLYEAHLTEEEIRFIMKPVIEQTIHATIQARKYNIDDLLMYTWKTQIENKQEITPNQIPVDYKRPAYLMQLVKDNGYNEESLYFDKFNYPIKHSSISINTIFVDYPDITLDSALTSYIDIHHVSIDTFFKKYSIDIIEDAIRPYKILHTIFTNIKKEIFPQQHIPEMQPTIGPPIQIPEIQPTQNPTMRTFTNLPNFDKLKTVLNSGINQFPDEDAIELCSIYQKYIIRLRQVLIKDYIDIKTQNPNEKITFVRMDVAIYGHAFSLGLIIDENNPNDLDKYQLYSIDETNPDNGSTPIPHSTYLSHYEYGLLNAFNPKIELDTIGLKSYGYGSIAYELIKSFRNKDKFTYYMQVMPRHINEKIEPSELSEFKEFLTYTDNEIYKLELQTIYDWCKKTDNTKLEELKQKYNNNHQLIIKSFWEFVVNAEVDEEKTYNLDNYEEWYKQYHRENARINSPILKFINMNHKRIEYNLKHEISMDAINLLFYPIEIPNVLSDKPLEISENNGEINNAIQNGFIEQILQKKIIIEHKAEIMGLIQEKITEQNLKIDADKITDQIFSNQRLVDFNNKLAVNPEQLRIAEPGYSTHGGKSNQIVLHQPDATMLIATYFAYIIKMFIKKFTKKNRSSIAKKTGIQPQLKETKLQLAEENKYIFTIEDNLKYDKIIKDNEGKMRVFTIDKYTDYELDRIIYKWIEKNDSNLLVGKSTEEVQHQIKSIKDEWIDKIVKCKSKWSRYNCEQININGKSYTGGNRTKKYKKYKL